MKKLTSKQIKALRAQAHHLSPVVYVGQYGVTTAVLRELNITLNDHELIKVHVRCNDQAELEDVLGRLSADAQAHLVQVIGHKVVFYRPGPKNKISLPA